MTDQDDLVYDLRHGKYKNRGHKSVWNLLVEAADRLEKSEARIAELEAKSQDEGVVTIEDNVASLTRFVDLEDEVKQLKDELAEAREQRCDECGSLFNKPEARLNQTTIDALNEDLTDAKEYSSADELIDDINAEPSDEEFIKQSRDKCYSDIDGHHIRIRDLCDRLESSNQEIARLSAALTASENRYADCYAANGALREERDEANARIAEMQKKEEQFDLAIDCMKQADKERDTAIQDNADLVFEQLKRVGKYDALLDEAHEFIDGSGFLNKADWLERYKELRAGTNENS